MRRRSAPAELGFGRGRDERGRRTLEKAAHRSGRPEPPASEPGAASLPATALTSARSRAPSGPDGVDADTDAAARAR